MPYKNRKSSYTNFILIFVLIKMGLNLLAISNFGFHRDELLHLALGDHLDWGYKEVPPLIAVLAKLTTTLFGNSVFAARIFTTLCSGLIIWLTGKITVELGGRKFAIALACLAVTFSPAFTASGYLFQPVVFDQLWWVLTVWLLLRYINTHAVKYLYFIGVAIGFGVLTKYTMLFFAGALILGLIISKQRRLLWNKHVLGAMG
ncbi:MAG TPA: glycosyltransferase family 39 protein, partial [Mucilaginibacter sp.]